MSEILFSINDFPDNVVIYRYIDNDFIFIDFNKNAEQTENISKEALLGKKLTEMFPTVKEFGLFDKLLEVHNTGKPQELKMTFYQDERISGWRHNSIRQLSNNDIIVFYKDLNDYKTLEEDIHNKTLQLNESEKNAHIGSWIWDIAKGSITWSDEVYRIFGEEPQSFDASYELFLSYLNKEDQIGLQAAVDESLKNKTSYSYEHRVVRKDNKEVYVRETGSTIYNNKGEAIRMLGNVLDITELEKDVLRSKEKIAKSLNLFDENVLASNSNLEGIITYVSQALCQMTGYSKDELIGKPHNIFRSSDTSTTTYKELWNTIKNGKNWIGEIKNKKKNGDFFWIRLTVIPEFDKNNNIISYSSVRQDITPEKVKELFMANMSHELRTPLNSIIGFSGILNKKLSDSHLLSLSENIYSSSKSLLKIINDILDLSKITSDKFDINPYEFNAFDEIIKHAEQFEGLIVQKKLTSTKNIDKSLQAIFSADWLRISQIILNLISNALKFTAEGGNILYEAKYSDGILILKISDTGIGMNQEVQNKVFQPFTQADGTTTRKYGGTGLGLSITQKLVELMDGTIELDSQEGKGTTFTVKVPLKKVREVSTTQSEVQKVLNKANTLNAHILIAEDNKTNQLLITMILNEFGITCDVANDGVEAIEIYDPQKHMLILMDENMPNMNGTTASRIIQEQHKEECCAIIALTANAMEGDKERFLSLGMDGYVAKPIDEDDLYNTLFESLPKNIKE